MQILPWINDLAAFSYDLTIGETIYNFSYNWNVRGSYWEMSIALFDLTPVILGMKIVEKYPLLKYHANDLLFEGSLICVPESKTVSGIPQFDNMGIGRGYVLVLVEPGDF